MRERTPINRARINFARSRAILRRLGSRRGFSEGDDIATSLRFAPLRPSFHHRSALFQRIAAPVRTFRRVADDVGERGFRDLTREMRLVSRPITKSAAKAVN